MKIRLLLTLFLALNATLWAAGQDRIRLHGIVTDEYNNPVEMASVIVERQGAFAVSGLKGHYSLTCRRTDSLFVTCMAVGYRTRKFVIATPQSDSLRYDLKINTVSYTLGEAGITAMRRQTEAVQSIKPSSTHLMPTTTGNGVEELIATQMGVSTHNELSSQYNVRGGSFDENSVYLNGVEVFRPFLVRSGQQEGLSIINSNMVADIDFSAGGYPAMYGDKMSSVLDITYKRPTAPEGSLSLSLMGADAYWGFGRSGTTADGRAKKGGEFSMLNGLRYKTTKLLLGSSDTKGEYEPTFVDYQNYTSWSPNKHWTLDFIGNLSYNNYRFKPSDRETSFGTMQDVKSFRVYFDGKEKDLFHTYFGSFGITRKFNAASSIQWLSSAYATKENETYDIQGEYWLSDATSQEQLGVGTYLEHARNFLTAHVYSTALLGRHRFGRHNVRWGLTLKSLHVKENSTEWEMRDSSGYSVPHRMDELQLIYNLRAKTSMSSTQLESYLQDSYSFHTAAGQWRLNGGVRLTHLSYTGETLFSPRASLGLIPTFNDRFTFRLAVGCYYQPPFYKELRDTVTTSGNTSVVLNKNLKSQRSVHFVLGMDYQFRMSERPFRFSVEAYYKALSRLIPYNINNLRVVYYGENLANGHAAGIDMKLFGEFVPGTDSWITVGLMQTRQKFHGHSMPLPTDQRYNISLFFTDYFPGSTRWRLTLKAALSDGLPFGPPHEGMEGHDFRAPSYRRVDIGMQYRLLSPDKPRSSRSLLKDIWLGVDALNLLDINNVSSYYWVTDITNNQYAVPNYLTGRSFNFRLTFDFGR